MVHSAPMTPQLHGEITWKLWSATGGAQEIADLGLDSLIRFHGNNVTSKPIGAPQPDSKPVSLSRWRH